MWRLFNLANLVVFIQPNWQILEDHPYLIIEWKNAKIKEMHEAKRKKENQLLKKGGVLQI